MGPNPETMLIALLEKNNNKKKLYLALNNKRIWTC